MPFKDLRHPPIQLGILKACLVRASISVRCHCLELAFMEHLHRATASLPDAERFTIDDYQEVAHRDFIVHLGDWIFKVPPYAPSSPADEAYLARVRDDLPEVAVTNAIRMKKWVPSFLDAAADDILADRPAIVGFSTVFQQNIPSLVLAKMLKERDPSVTIVFGGDNCDGPMGAALHESFPWVDIVVRGEGERVFPEVVRDVLAHRPLRPQPGLCYRGDGGSIAVPMETSPGLCMDEVPVPIYDEFFDRLDQSPLKEELSPQIAILFESSRGCWWGQKAHCTFCGLNGSTMAFRSKRADDVAREILEMASRYKCLDFVAVDDIIDMGHVRDLLPLLSAAGCDLNLFYETKANLKKAHLQAFHSAGVTVVQPGIESLSTPILKLMRKGVTALQNVRLLKWCAEIGITPEWNLLYGFPGEAPEEYERMAALIPQLVHFEPPNLCSVAVQRFSPYFDTPQQLGLEITGPGWFYPFLYSIPPESLANLAYDFEHRFLDGRDPESYIGPTAEAVTRWREVGSAAAGSLSYRRGPDFLIVHDRRPGFDEANYRFDGVEAAIYLGCDAGATPADLHAQVTAADGELSVEDIADYLNELVESGLMYREGNRYLSLATAAHARVSAPSIQYGATSPGVDPATITTLQIAR
jgi:ribosomal peptide maturation radical SAM protein 1